MAQMSDMPETKPLHIKRENGGLVSKSSTEILTELFEVFNAEPPKLTTVVSDDSKKRKKYKKKNKHKKKKKKKLQKKGRSSSDESSSETETDYIKRKAKKNKKKKRKHRKSESSSSDSDSNESKNNDSDEEVPVKRRNVSKENVEIDNILLKQEQEDIKYKKNELEMDILPFPKISQIPIMKSSEDKKPLEKSETTDKTKIGSNKIQIKNLKFSSVFEANVKLAEEEARKKAEKYEDGELTDTSCSSATTKVTSSPGTEQEVNKKNETDIPKKSTKNSEGNLVPSITKEKNCEKEKTPEKISHRSRSKSKSKSHKSSHRRSTSHSRSRKRTNSRSHSRSKSRRRSRSISRHHKSDRYRRSRSHHRHDRRDDKSKSHKSDRRRSRERENRIEIDKKRLLEIARKNVITMLQTGTLPNANNLGSQAQKNVITAIKCGGKSVDELTDFCKNLSRQEAIGELSSVSSPDVENDVDAATKPFNNPFQIKDRAPIVMNIKGGTPLPTQSFQEKTIEQTKVLRQQFPVSSGTQHRGAENEWRPVSPPPPAPSTKISHSSENSSKTNSHSSEKSYIQHSTSLSDTFTPSVPLQTCNVPLPPGPQVFPNEVNTSAMDLSTIVSQRLTAIRKLQQNPNDTTALNQMYQANQEMTKWVQSKQEPGQFTGSTGAQILTPKELASGYQAWARKLDVNDVSTLKNENIFNVPVM